MRPRKAVMRRRAGGERAQLRDATDASVNWKFFSSRVETDVCQSFGLCAKTPRLLSIYRRALQRDRARLMHQARDAREIPLGRLLNGNLESIVSIWSAALISKVHFTVWRNSDLFRKLNTATRSEEMVAIYKYWFSVCSRDSLYIICVRKYVIMSRLLL